MNSEFNNNENTSEKYSWNYAMVLDKIQEVLDGKNIDELEFSEEELSIIEAQLSSNLSLNDINESAFLVADSIDELNVLPDEDARDYILRLKNYLDNSTFKAIKGEFKGIEFEVYPNSSVDEVFDEYYSRYDEAYGISEMLSDLGILK